MTGTTDLGAYEAASENAVLAAARYPDMTEQTSYDGAPAGAAAGVAMNAPNPNGVLAALTKVALRAHPSYRQCVVTIPNFVAAQTYTVTINGVAYAHLDITGVEADTYAALEALIDVGATAALVQSTASATQLLVFAVVETSFSIGVSTSGGGATILATCEPETADMRLFALENDRTSDAPTRAWVYISDTFVGVDYRGLIQRQSVGGLKRLYIELESIAGNAADVAGANGTITQTPAYVGIGPCLLESQIQT